MSANSTILELVQEILESNRATEEVCLDHPELHWEVRRQLKRARGIAARLTEIFPTSTDESTVGKLPALTSSDLPDIPGYRIEDMIGSGGMGVVFRARQLEPNRLVAVKMLRSGAFASQQEQARFSREAEALAALSHPHIVQIYDLGSVERHPYFAMELLEGGTLASRLAGAPQPARQSAQLVATLAAAVTYAHQRGIVHRDLKPANILLTADDTPKIADFGLIRRVDGPEDLTISGARLGTPSYMAPEQASGDTSAVGPAIDIYALGAILYEMLTGRPPFRGNTAAETERQVVVESPVHPSRLNANTPRDLEAICLKCLEKEPQNRYPSAGDLAADLGRFLRNKPIYARPVGQVDHRSRWTRRNRILPALAVASVFLFRIASAKRCKNAEFCQSGRKRRS
jgi:serine/threonine-protein kinase